MRETLFQGGVVTGIAALLALASAWLHPLRPPFYEVVDPSRVRWEKSPEELATILTGAADVLWVDARSREKYEEGHREDAILLNPEEWGDLMFDHMDRLQDAMGKPVVVYCDGTRCDRSHEVATRLRELLGLQPVYVLKGEWRERGGEP